MELLQKQIKKKLLDILNASLSFNKSIAYSKVFENFYLPTTVKEILTIYRLRSKIYTSMDYHNEFQDIIQGLNFDYFDTHSAILYTKKNNQITGTCRVIVDSQNKLPIDANYSLKYLRNQKKKLAEVSRLIIEKDAKGLSQEFKFLTQGVYSIISNNSIDISVSVIQNEHFKLYNKFGGFYIEKNLETYGNLDKPFIITSWNILKVSNFFKKVFLDNSNLDAA